MSRIVGKSDKDKIPEGAVLISEDKALKIQKETIRNWEPKSDVWFFKFGPGILSATSIVSSTLIMHHYRRKLKLHAFGRPVMFIPGVIFPALAVPVIHQMAVLDPILLQHHCPVCIQMRGLTIQSMAAIVYPIVVHSLGSFMLANSFATCRIPEFSIRKPGNTWSFWRKISKPLFGNLPIHFLLQLGVSIFITEMEAKELFKIQASIAMSQQPS